MADREKVVYHAANTGDEVTCPAPSARLATPTRDAQSGEVDADEDDEAFTGVRVEDRQLEPPKPQRNGPIMLFDRASPRWWDPQFDSDILERKYGEMSFPERRSQFRSCLWYVGVSAVVWAGFYACLGGGALLTCAAACSLCLVTCLAFLRLTYLPCYQRFQTTICTLFALMLCLGLLGFLATMASASCLDTVAIFTLAVEVLLVLYSLVPLRLYVCAGLGVVFSAGFEALVVFAPRHAGVHSTLDEEQIVARALMHIALHLMGIHIYIMAQVRGRSTFLKVCQSALSRKDLIIEEQLKERMIHSLMPPKVAKEIMSSRDKADDEHRRSSAGQTDVHISQPDKKKKKKSTRSRVKGHGKRGRRNRPGSMKVGNDLDAFRSFHMSKMENVTILFADIVGFTKMSSNKTAEHLVSLLNDLFGRFDVICEKSGCEKISTLGDCYYSVSGCPEPRPDHARCSVEMGLEMCKAIQQFDIDHNESVNMRVGVHTGMVLCGLVGTRRFKFDVWSYDVTLANTMESEGQPGRVHISDSTYDFIRDEYEVEQGEDVEDIRKKKVLIERYNANTQSFIIQHIREEDVIKTWFIIGNKKSMNEKCDSKHGSMVEKSALDMDNISGNGVNAVLSKQDSHCIEFNSKNQEENNAALMQTLVEHKKQTDKQLVNGIEENIRQNRHDTIHRISLNFRDDTFEQQYRRQSDTACGYNPQRIDYCTASGAPEKPTLALPRYSAFTDLAISFAYLVVFTVSCALAFGFHPAWVIIALVVALLEILQLVPAILATIYGKEYHTSKKIAKAFANWHTRHLAGSLIASGPAAIVLAAAMASWHSQLHGVLLVGTLVHFCNFTTLNSWMKSCAATLALACYVLYACMRPLQPTSSTAAFPSQATDYVNTSGWVNGGSGGWLSNLTRVGVAGEGEGHASGQTSLDNMTMLLSTLMLLALVWFLNREFEIGYRLSVHGNMQATRDSEIMNDTKEQADWLLHNIIPEHVSNILKKSSKYCENHKDVGVLFAKVVNYDDFYDESYEAGRENMRVLNELMGDFEMLFKEEKYRDVEKIKTIGSCLMAASGLNPSTRSKNKYPNAHLYQMMEFAQDLLEKLDDFNNDILSFDFAMAIGYNYGEVTSGVIGTTKLLYDIWGDTVNISSRMYSTGVVGKIQVTEDTADKLSDMFEFEYRDKIFVKGKGDMKTYLLTKKKDGACWD